MDSINDWYDIPADERCGIALAKSRLALDILGPVCVRAGMSSFDEYRSFSMEGCFIGRACGWHATAIEPLYEAELACWVARAYDYYPKELRAECIRYLAEHGEAYEPALAKQEAAAQ